MNDLAIAHLDYEVQALLDNAALLFLHHAGEHHNQVLEAYFVHYRLLAEFLGARPSARHEELDYTPEKMGVRWAFPPDTDADAQLVTADLRVADRHVVHLSMARVEEQAPTQWDIAPGLFAMRRLLAKFAGAMDHTPHAGSAMAWRAYLANFDSRVRSSPENPLPMVNKTS